ncbi:MAG: SH3 domain-containing protein, partial [Clostridia bacterium]|nr:SH3 domain-containing protein [Clostridia bacterium]
MKLCKIVISLLLVFCTIAAPLTLAVEPGGMIMTVYADTQKVTITGDNVNVRSGAGTSYSKVTTAKKGATYNVLGTSKDSSGKKWYKISVSGKTGYVIETYVKVSTVTTTTSQQRLTVTANKVNVRSGAGSSYSKVTSVDKGAVFTVLGSAKDSSGKTWYKISVSGKTGYIISDYASVSAAPTTTTTTAAQQKLTVTANKVNVRSGAGSSYSKVTTVNSGATYTVLGSAKDSSGKVWYKISVGGKTGYIISTYAKLSTASTTTTTKKPTTTTAASGDTLTAKSAAGVYASPTKSAAKSATMKAGTVYKYTSVYTGGDKVKWYLVTVGTARGWVCSSDVTLGGTTTTTKKPTTTTAASGDTLTAKSAAGVYASPTKSAAKS